MAFLASLLGIGAAVSAQDQADPGGRPAGMPAIPPPPIQGLGGHSLPASFKPGFRETYYNATAILRGACTALAPDPEGNWVTPDGQRFSQSDVPTAAAEAFSHLDIVATGDFGVAAVNRCYGIATNIDPQGQQVKSLTSVIPTFGSVLAPGQTDLWADTDELKKLDNIAQPGLTVSRSKYRTAGNNYDAVFIANQSDRGSSLCVYDSETGILLHYASASLGSDPAAVASGGDATPTTMLVQATLLNTRQINLPWADAPLPNFAEGSVRNFKGKLDQVNFGLTFPRTLSVKVTQRARDFMVTAESNFCQVELPETITRVSGSAEINPPYIPPETLERLEQGQTIDRDPITKIAVTVNIQAQTPTHNDAVVLTEAPPDGSFQYDYMYDKTTGLLVALGNKEKSVGIQTQSFWDSREP